MLAGKRAFEGEDVSDTLAAILRGEPDWNALPAAVPSHVRAMLRQCVQRDRSTRIPDISVVRFLLDEGGRATEAPPAAAVESAGTVRRQRRVLRAWQAIAALLLVTTVAMAGAWRYASRPARASTTRFHFGPPDSGTFTIIQRPGAAAAISPDGLNIAFTASDASGKTLLWVRPIDALIARALPGTDDAANPFWSPDSRMIAYSTRGRLMKVAASGGSPQTLCTLSGPAIVGRGGSWSSDGVIVFSNGPGQPIA